MRHGAGADNLTFRGYCISQEPQQMRLYVARREGLYLLTPPQYADSEIKEAKKITNGEFIYGVGYDYGDRKLFWTDRLSHSAFTASLLGKFEIVFVKIL